MDELAADGIRLYFTNVKGYLRDAMKRSGLYEKIGEAHFFLSKYDAVQYFRKQMTQPVDIIEPQKR